MSGGGPSAPSGPLTGRSASIASALRYVIGEAQLHRLGAVGDRAAADGDDQIGLRFPRHGGRLDHRLPRGVRRHVVEQPGKPVAERAAHLFDLVGGAVSVPLTIRKTRLAPRRRASSASVSAAGLPKLTASIARMRRVPIAA